MLSTLTITIVGLIIVHFNTGETLLTSIPLLFLGILAAVHAIKALRALDRRR